MPTVGVVRETIRWVRFGRAGRLVTRVGSYAELERPGSVNRYIAWDATRPSPKAEFYWIDSAVPAGRGPSHQYDSEALEVVERDFLHFMVPLARPEH
ncbi:hypothetical protein ACWKWC_02460 [Geodermatophilus nigrescens]